MATDLDFDLSLRCPVLVADPGAWREVLRKGVSVASMPDGRSLYPVRVNPQDIDELTTDETLDLLEYGAVMVADLNSLEPDVFALVSWYAHARPESVILLRRGLEPLPFELHNFAVRGYSHDSPQNARAGRTTLGDRALAGAYARSVTVSGRIDPTAMAGNRALRRRRERNGVSEALRATATAILVGDIPEAGRAMAAALRAEPDAYDLLLRVALLHRAGGQWANAIAPLEAAVRANPRSPAAWRELGVVRQHGGLEGAADALRRALDIREDFEALVTLALLLGRRGEVAESARLLQRALAASGGQLNLVLPTLVLRAGQQGSLHISPWEAERVREVLSIRANQARGEPPQDAPWSFFDAARAHLLLGENEEALALAAEAKNHLSAPWQTETFGDTLDSFERAGVDVQPLRDALDIKPKTKTSVVETPTSMEVTPPFPAATRDPAWFVNNVPCMSACPVGTDAGSYVHLIAERRFEEAFRVARGPNPFASVCGRICAAPCEDACRRGNIDAPVEIRSLKRFLTERHGVEGVEQRTDEVLDGTPTLGIEGDAYASHLRELGSQEGRRKVAVVGGGPAGLACAHDLALLGHEVTLFEASHQLGGMMRQGIPIYRLSRDLLELEIGAIISLGVKVELGKGLSAERTLKSIFEQGYDAAFLSSGAGRGRDLEVEGSELDGVVRAIDFLLNANQGYRMDMGSRVVVVGGGNVALDVARTARLGHAPETSSHGAARQAAKETFGEALEGAELRRAMRGRRREVHVIARQPFGEWPAQRTVRGGEEMDHARDEGIVFHPLRGVRRVRGANGKVTAVELAEVVQVYDSKGRYAPRYGGHTAEVLECDTLFLAVGQEPELDYLMGTAEVTRTPRGLIEVDPETLATKMPGVFAGGDAAFGPRTVIEAVADGKRAARNIQAYFSGGRRLPVSWRFDHIHPRAVPTADGYDATPREAPPCTEVGRRTGIAEVEGSYDEQKAVEQASRCLVCHVQTVFEGEKCIACGRCTTVCPYSCLSFAPPADVALDENNGLDTAGGEVYMVKDEDQCVRCGLCAEVCPTGAMTMEQFSMNAVEASQELVQLKGIGA